jgi:protease I
MHINAFKSHLARCKTPFIERNPTMKIFMKTSKKSLIVIAFLSVLGTQSALAVTFAPIQDNQIPSGTAPAINQPPVENLALFRGKHVAILASHGVEESEIKFPYDYLVARGAQVDILVPSWTPQGVSAVRYLKPTLWVEASNTFQKAQGTHYDLLVLTGGAWNAQVVRTDPDALKLISEHYHQGLPIAAICAGTSVLINSGIAQGQTMTGSPVVATDLINAGARFVDQALVMGDHLATSRTPDDLPEFVGGIRKLLIGR